MQNLFSNITALGGVNVTGTLDVQNLVYVGATNTSPGYGAALLQNTYGINQMLLTFNSYSQPSIYAQDANSSYQPLWIVSSPLLINPNGAYVGIGTTSPGYTLDVAGAGNFSAGLYLNGTSVLTGATAYNYVQPSQTGVFVTTGDARNLSFSNRVAIGKSTTPNYTLDVNGSGSFSSGLFVSGNSVLTGVNLTSYVTTGQTGAFYAASNPSGFITGVNLTSYVLTGDTRTLTFSGKMSVGKSTSPNYTLDVNGSGNFSSGLFVSGVAVSTGQSQTLTNVVFTTGNQTISGSKTFAGSGVFNNPVAIGVSSPGYTLDVNGTIGNSTSTTILDGIGGVQLKVTNAPICIGNTLYNGTYLSAGSTQIQIGDIYADYSAALLGIDAVAGLGYYPNGGSASASFFMPSNMNGFQVGYVIIPKFGVNNNNPLHTLDVSGDGNFTSSVYVSGKSAFLSGVSVGKSALPSYTLDVNGSGNFSSGLFVSGVAVSTGQQQTLTNVVFTTGAQTVSGAKTFATGLTIKAATVITDSSDITPLSITGSFPSYQQIYIQNFSSGTSASSDIVATADVGSENNYYVDLGINSSTYSGASVGNSGDAYLFSVANDFYIGNATGNRLYLFAGNSPYLGSQAGITVFNNKLGVGNTTPIYNLDVVGSGNFSSGLYVSGASVLTGVNLTSYVTTGQTGSFVDIGSNQTISGVKTFNSNIGANYATITTGAGATITLNFQTGEYYLTIPASIANSTGYSFALTGLPSAPQVLSTSVFLYNTGYTGYLTFPSGWVFMGSQPTTLASGKSALLSVKSYGGTTTVAGYSVQY